MNTFRLIFFIITLSSSFQVIAYDNCTEESTKCSFAIFPHSNFQQLLITYKSVLEDLSLVLNSRVKLVSSRGMSDFAYKLDTKLYDIALIGPGQYISHGHPAGYIPIVSRSGVLKMQLFVKAESDIYSYEQLKGKVMGLMNPQTTTWYTTSILLQENGIQKKDIKFVGLDSQQACAHAIAINRVDACVFAVSNFEIIKEQNVATKFRTIGDALRIHNPVYAVHPDMSVELIDDLRSYLLSRDGYVDVKDKDFEGFRYLISLIEE